jgi:acetyl esterase/lipase
VLKYRLFRTSSEVLRETDEFIANPASKATEMRALLAKNLADGQQAIRIVRSRAAEWGVDPGRIGFLGFSAGGGVTTQVALNFTSDCRPDFAAPIYAAVFDEVQAPLDAPPLFLLCAADDEMASRASLILYSAWKAAQRLVEMHIYASGGHGFGTKQQGLPCDTWLERFADWLRGLGYA